MHKPADRIRNVALIGHRGSGKTSLHEALLFEAGATNRLGSVLDGTTVSDSEPDEQSRKMSISLSLSSFEWDGRKINLLDTPGEPSFVADALGALRVCESAVFVVNAVMGVEVSTQRLWERAAELDIARLVFVNMLDRERADFFRALAVEHVHEQQAGDVELCRALPEPLRVDLDAHHGVDDEDRRLADPERPPDSARWQTAPRSRTPTTKRSRAACPSAPAWPPSTGAA